MKKIKFNIKSNINNNTKVMNRFEIKILSSQSDYEAFVNYNLHNCNDNS